jgi:heme/copper-type cytochrome/quinol oxidase subunit 4
VVLVSLVSIIFAQILPDLQATNLQLAIGIAFVIILNTVVSHWLARRGTEFRHVLVQFVVMAVINFGLALLYVFLLPSFDGSVNLTDTLFFVLLLTLIVTLFDRYYPHYQARFAPSA